MEGKTSDIDRELRELALASLKALETEHGILASSKSEAYGCIFGRDSLITLLLLLRTTGKSDAAHDEYVFSLARKALSTLADLQGKEVNIESGEEPGKCIHEWRPADHEHLTARGDPPWYLYPEGAMKNYDSVDATPLFVMAFFDYVNRSGDMEFFREKAASIDAALHWLSSFGDSNQDGFIDYGFHPARAYGGLRTQSWMDSTESLFHEGRDGRPEYPVAPVEVQGYAYAAFRAAADFFAAREAEYTAAERAIEYRAKAQALKERFNARFVIEGPLGAVFPYALDGNGEPLLAARSSIGHLLFSAWRNDDGTVESVLDARHIGALVGRIFAPDLYESAAGIRTLSTASPRFDAVSYHNGSIWPHDTALIAEGLLNFGYEREAKALYGALLSAYRHFRTPLELYGHSEGQYLEYYGHGKGACRVQAWSVAALIASLDAAAPVSSALADAEATAVSIASSV